LNPVRLLIATILLIAFTLDGELNPAEIEIVRRAVMDNLRGWP